jgi:hypothetical protein
MGAIRKWARNVQIQPELGKHQEKHMHAHCQRKRCWTTMVATGRTVISPFLDAA